MLRQTDCETFVVKRVFIIKKNCKNFTCISLEGNRKGLPGKFRLNRMLKHLFSCLTANENNSARFCRLFAGSKCVLHGVLHLNNIMCFKLRLFFIQNKFLFIVIKQRFKSMSLIDKRAVPALYSQTITRVTKLVRYIMHHLPTSSFET